MPGDASGKPLHGMFTVVPPRYDLVNRIITLGLDRRWREAAARACLESSPKRVLDLACGTGDLAIAIARRAGVDMEVVGLDYSQPMLEMARRKAQRLRQVALVHGDAASLPFTDGYFDCVGISFAFRNLTYRTPLARTALAGVLRVLKPGGRFVIVETSQPESRLIRRLFHLYLATFVAGAGYLLSGNRGAYRSLAESAARCYSEAEVKDLLTATGFRGFSSRPLFFGAAAVHIAVK